MTHDEYIKKRDELLDAYRNHELQVAGGVYLNDDPKLSYAEAAKAIDALVLQVIGELERPEFYEKKVYVCHTCKSELHIPHAPSVSRDALRTEQRKTVQGEKS